MLGTGRCEVKQALVLTATVSATKPYKKARGLERHNRDVFAGCLTERSGSRINVQGGPSQTGNLQYATKRLFHGCGKKYLSHVLSWTGTGAQDQGLYAADIVGADKR